MVQKEKVRGVVSMNEDFELRYWVPSAKEWAEKGVQFLQLNTPDIFHAPSQEKLRRGVQFIQEFQGTDGSVYVHCKAGRTRSATLVGCYLMQRNNWDPQTAIDFMKSKRTHVLLRSKQLSAINTYYQEHVEPQIEQPVSDTNTRATSMDSSWFSPEIIQNHILLLPCLTHQDSCHNFSNINRWRCFNLSNHS